MQSTIATIKQRKTDTRKKIQMGGLIIKAELDHLHSTFHPELMYGMLLHCKKLLQDNPAIKDVWITLGNQIRSATESKLKNYD